MTATSDTLLTRQIPTARINLALIWLIGALALWYQFMLLFDQEWGDESETVVAAKMLASGMRLYSEVFNHHGPLSFLSGYLLELAGNFGVAGHRVPIAVMQWLALFAIYRSPLLRERPERAIFVAVAMTAVLDLLPQDLMFGHAYLYQTIAGLFFIVIVAQHTVPVIGQMAPAPAGVAISSVLNASLPFLAVSYVPAAGLLFLASLTRATWKRALAWSLGGVFANLAWLGWIGSFKGFLAYHIYLNTKVMPEYRAQDLAAMIDAVASSVSWPSSVSTVNPLIPLVLAGASLVMLERKRLPWRSVLLLLALLSFTMRGIMYHGAPFWYGLIALAALMTARYRRVYEQQGALFALLLVCAGILARPLLQDHSVFDSRRRPETTAFGELAKALTDKDDRVIAYSFRNFDYLAADRLPASGHFFYLPWQERYNQAPQYGIYQNACEDIRKARPKLVYLDNNRIWGKFPWSSYGGCIQAVVDAGYRRLPSSGIYVRNDYYDRALQLLPTLELWAPMR